jgi:transposase-like protein
MFHFKTLKQLLTHFADETICRQYLEEKRWKGQPVCPYCGTKKVYRLTDGKRFKCGNKKECDRKFSVTVGTIYQNSKIPLGTWFAAIYLATSHKKGISSLQLARDLGITDKTAWFLLHRIRHMVNPATEITLNGTVQVDETYVKGKNKNRTKKQRRLIAEGKRLDRDTPVMGFVNEGKAVLQVVRRVAFDTVHPLVKKVVTDEETVIVTDGSNVYCGLEDCYKGRIIINHAQDEYKVGPYHTNSVEGAFSLFKRTIFGTYHYVSPKHLQRYCTLFSYRFNTRKMNGDERFDDTMSNVEGNLTYQQLIGK